MAPQPSCFRGNSRFPARFCGNTPPIRLLLQPQAREFHGESHPAVQQFTQTMVIAELFLHQGKILLPHKMTLAVSLPGEADLIVGTMLNGGIGLAAAMGFAADVVLLSQI